MEIVNSRNILLLLLLIFSGGKSFAFSDNDSLLKELNKLIPEAAKYETQKLKRIDGLKLVAATTARADKIQQYNIYLQIFEEYKTFNYDSAFLFINKLTAVSSELNDPVKATQA